MSEQAAETDMHEPYTVQGGIYCTACDWGRDFTDNGSPGSWSEHIRDSVLEQRSSSAEHDAHGRPSNERDGACICDYNPSTTDGPDECCPFHGRPYAYWIERGDALDERLAAVRTILDAMGDPLDPMHLHPQAASLLIQMRDALDCTYSPAYPPGDPGDISERCAATHVHGARCSQDEIGDWWHITSPAKPNEEQR